MSIQLAYIFSTVSFSTSIQDKYTPALFFVHFLILSQFLNHYSTNYPVRFYEPMCESKHYSTMWVLCSKETCANEFWNKTLTLCALITAAGYEPSLLHWTVNFLQAFWSECLLQLLPRGVVESILSEYLWIEESE